MIHWHKLTLAVWIHHIGPQQLQVVHAFYSGHLQNQNVQGGENRKFIKYKNKTTSTAPDVRKNSTNQSLFNVQVYRYKQHNGWLRCYRCVPPALFPSIKSISLRRKVSTVAVGPVSQITWTLLVCKCRICRALLFAIQALTSSLPTGETWSSAQQGVASEDTVSRAYRWMLRWRWGL